MKDLNKYIDHTLLKADAKKEDIIKLCKEARDYDFMSVCINPGWVRLAKSELESSQVKVCTVIGFPLGASSKEVKAFETQRAIEDGAEEVDMVINIGRLKSEDYDYVLEDIRGVVEASRGRALVKLIIETSLLSQQEKVRACQLGLEAGVDFVKTSTGFSQAGAKIEDVALMRATVGPKLGVKASGGVRSYKDALEFIGAGASRLGASSGLEIIREAREDN